MRPRRDCELGAAGDGGFRCRQGTRHYGRFPSWARNGGIPHAGGRRNRQAQPRRADTHALQRIEFHPGSAASDAGQGADHYHRHAHQLRHLIPGAWMTTSGKRGALLVLASLLCAGLAAAEEQRSAAQMMDDLMYGRGPIGGPFTLTDHTGRRRSDAEFRGKLMIVYFGYSYCPDVCPTDLMAITQALNSLGPLATQVQPVFITIDPERDTLVLAEYVSAFHRALSALPARRRKFAPLLLRTRCFTRKCRASGAGSIRSTMPA